MSANRDSHATICLDDIPFLQVLISLAEKRSSSLYLVGGAVRNMFLCLQRKDLDFVLSHGADTIPRAFSDAVKGSFFWLDQERLQSRVVVTGGEEIITFDFAPIRGGSIEEDLRLRDFTMNAMAISVDGELLDPWGGANDLVKGLLKICSPSAFEDDPLRMLRAFRFAAAFGFSMDAETARLISTSSTLIGGVASERIREEMFKIIESPRAAEILQAMWETGLMQHVFPLTVKLYPEGIRAVEAVLAKIPSLFPVEALQVEKHLQREIEGGISAASLLKFAGLIGWHNAPVKAAADQLKLGNLATKILNHLVEPSDVLLSYARTDRAAFRYVRDHEAAVVESLIAMLKGVENPEVQDRCRFILNFFFNLYDSSSADSLVTGYEVMDRFGIPKGPALGNALAVIRQGEREGAVENRDQAFVYLEKNLLTKS